MKLNTLSPAPGAVKRRKRVGRGDGSGWGKTSGRGEKGQKARSGGGVRPGFEGGQMPIARRLPKRGFTNIFARRFVIVNIDQLNSLDAGSEVTKCLLKERGIISSSVCPLKILGRGELTVKNLRIVADAWSQEALRKVQARGGQVEKASCSK